MINQGFLFVSWIFAVAFFTAWVSAPFLYKKEEERVAQIKFATFMKDCAIITALSSIANSLLKIR